MDSTEQRIGPWVVRYEWELGVSRLNPSRVVIEPAPDARPEDLVGGISSTVTRDMRPARPASDRPTLQDAVNQLQTVTEQRPSNPTYLAVLAAVYAAATDALIPNPVAWISEQTGRPANTVKAHVAAARKTGMLTAVSSHLPGGVLTQQAEIVLGRTAVPRLSGR